jgi:hypothetical protein
VTVGRERAWVVDVLDDHARYRLAELASFRLTGAPARAYFVAAAAQHGLRSARGLTITQNSGVIVPSAPYDG